MTMTAVVVAVVKKSAKFNVWEGYVIYSSLLFAFMYSVGEAPIIRLKK